MKVYDTVNKLAQEIQESVEYINFKKAKEAVDTNLDIKNQIDEFEKIRYQEQMSYLESGNKNEERIKKIQEMYIKLVENNVARDYFDAELKFNIMIGDVNKIISEAVKDLIIK